MKVINTVGRAIQILIVIIVVVFLFTVLTQ